MHVIGFLSLKFEGIYYKKFSQIYYKIEFFNENQVIPTKITKIQLMKNTFSFKLFTLATNAVSIVQLQWFNNRRLMWKLNFIVNGAQLSKTNVRNQFLGKNEKMLSLFCETQRKYCIYRWARESFSNSLIIKAICTLYMNRTENFVWNIYTVFLSERHDLWWYEYFVYLKFADHWNSTVEITILAVTKVV